MSEIDREYYDLVLSAAKRIWLTSNPGKDWILHPTTAQQRVQERYFDTARTIIWWARNSEAGKK